MPPLRKVLQEPGYDPFELEKAIVGAKFSPEGIRAAMSGLPLNNILGGITGEQFIECIFK